MKNMFLKNTEQLDEAQEKALGKAALICIGITVIYLVIEIAFKYFTTKDISNCTWEIALISIIVSVFCFVTRNQKEFSLPKSILGVTLPTEQTKNAKKIRVKSYIIESISFGVISVIGDILFDYLDFFGQSTADKVFGLIICFIISFSVEYFYGEYKCSKYEKWLEILDQED